MPKVEQVGENDWEFVYPPKYKQLMDKFGEGIDLWEMGHTRSAEKTYKEIIRLSPKVAKELLKKKHPPPRVLYPDRCTVGGHDEAFYYWERSGILWEDPEMKEWLLRNAGKGEGSK